MDLNSSILWGIIGLVGSFLFSFLFYKLSKSGKKITYSVKSQPLITKNIGNIHNLSITYKNNPISELLSTTLSVKITGKDIIEKKDFASVAPLCIKTDGEFLLQDDINSILTYNSNPANSLVPVFIDKSTISLSYDYFKYNSVFTFTILHTGNLTISGELKKGNIICSNSINRKSLLDILSIITMLLGVTFIVLIFFVGTSITALASLFINCMLNIGIGIVLIDYYIKTTKSNIE